MKLKILVIDDEEVIRDSLKQLLLRDDNYNVETAETGELALEIISTKSFDIAIIDLKLPGISGMEVLQKIKENYNDIIPIVITGHATVSSAVESMRLGAYDFIPKPINPDEFRLIIKRAAEKKKLLIENLYLQEQLKMKTEDSVILGKSKAMQKIWKLVTKVAPTDSTVLITGESGTGKELVARAIHNNSSRKNSPFITVDCGSLVENLFESELFGHVKGSFTGAVNTKYGRFELANGGTIFFDEVANISTNIQGKLLRAIQEREITKVGSNDPIPINVRVISATNKDLEHAVKEESFRDDLYYRLNVVHINLPPLRERKEDVPVLSNYFLNKYNQKRKKNIKSIAEDAMEILVNYEWLGNVRELENIIERAVVLTENEIIKPDDLIYCNHRLEETAMQETSKHKKLAEVEKEHILRTLKAVNWHKSKASELLDIDRKTLSRKLSQYKIPGKD